MLVTQGGPPDGRYLLDHDLRQCLRNLHGIGDNHVPRNRE